jgi:hypothetical protein
LRYKSRKAVREDILGLENVLICTHDDADGIASAELFVQALKTLGYDTEEDVEIEFAKEFGVNEFEANVMLDQVPKDPEFDGIVIDHHSGNIKRRSFDYKLWYETYPTSLIVYNLFKKEIPNPWKVVVGIAGDGQPELTPIEIWDSYPELFLHKASIYRSGARTNVYRNPMFTMLSSGINAISRAESEDQMGPGVAYQVLKQMEHPIDLVYNPMAAKAKGLLRSEETSTMNKFAPIDLGKVMFWQLETKYNILSRLATVLESVEKKTIVAVHMDTGKISVRGVHAMWVKNKLPEFHIDGHSKWMGGQLEDNQTPQDLLRAMMERLR